MSPDVGGEELLERQREVRVAEHQGCMHAQKESRIQARHADGYTGGPGTYARVLCQVMELEFVGLGEDGCVEVRREAIETEDWAYLNSEVSALVRIAAKTSFTMGLEGIWALDRSNNTARTCILRSVHMPGDISQEAFERLVLGKESASYVRIPVSGIRHSYVAYLRGATLQDIVNTLQVNEIMAE